MQISAFEPRFGPDVVELIVGIQRGEFAIPITAEDQPDLHDIPGFYQVDSGNFWLALDGERVVGTIALLDLGAGRGALRKMFVHSAFRGGAHGTAARLLDTLLQWARTRGFREILLGTTEKFLAAHRFYEKHGFQEIAKSALPPEFPVMAVDKKFYRMELEVSAS